MGLGRAGWRRATLRADQPVAQHNDPAGVQQATAMASAPSRPDPTPRRRRSQPDHGRSQLTLVEHALCPLDTDISLRPGEHQAEFFYTDKNKHRKKATARILRPLGLSP